MVPLRKVGAKSRREEEEELLTHQEEEGTFGCRGKKSGKKLVKMEVLLRRLREETRLRGEAWLQSQVSALLGSETQSAEEPRRRSRRARPPERLSPESTPRTRRRRVSHSRDSDAATRRPAAERQARHAGTSRAGGWREEQPGKQSGSAARPAGARRVHMPAGKMAAEAGGSSAPTASGGMLDAAGGLLAPAARPAFAEAAKESSGPAARKVAAGGSVTPAANMSGPLNEQEGGVRRRSTRRATVAVTPAPGLQCGDQKRRRQVPRQGSGEAGQPTGRLLVGGECAERAREPRSTSGSSVEARGGGGGVDPPLSSAEDSMEDGELQDEGAPRQERSTSVRGRVGPIISSHVGGSEGSGLRASETAAAGSGSLSGPGECLLGLMQGVNVGGNGLDGAAWAVVGQLLSVLSQQRLGTGGPASPATVWASDASGTGGGSTVMEQSGLVGNPVASGTAGMAAQSSSTGASGSAAGSDGAPSAGDDVRLADAAKGEVYVCFEGPLGAHLKPEFKEKIWKDEYVEIFSLLPLEKFNLDRRRPDESKKEEEERRRYRLIPRTFTNWLQAFSILASVIGEKALEHCSALFCYLDAIGEAYRVYGGLAWLRYDEQFRQRKAVRPSLRWDHKDISLWMKLMSAARAGGGQPFPGAAGGSNLSGQSAGARRGCCWQFNEGYCKFGGDCRYKHECLGCGGAHSLSRCFKKGRAKAPESQQKGGDAGAGGRDAALSRDLPR